MGKRLEGLLNKKLFVIKSIHLTIGNIIELFVIFMIIYTVINTFLACGPNPYSTACEVNGNQAGFWIWVFISGEILFRGVIFLHKLLNKHK